MSNLWGRTIVPALSVFASLALGCASEKKFVAHAYPGEPRPAAEVAEVVVLPRIRLMSVDGKRVETLPVDLALSNNNRARRTLFLLPGSHKLIAGIAADFQQQSSGAMGGYGMQGNVGFGVGFTPGAGGRLIPGSKSNDEIAFAVEAGKRYILLTTTYHGGDDEDKSRLVLKLADQENSPELQTFIARTAFEDPYGAKAPAAH